MAYEHEDEELEKLKEWWKENGTATILGIGVGLTLIFGWKGWQAYTQAQGEAASNVYQQVLSQFTASQPEPAHAAAGKLMNEFSGSSYAALTSLLLAKQAVDEAKPQVAEVHLDWVMANSDIPQLATVARLRKARLLLDSGDHQAALELLQQDGLEKSAFAPLVLILKGDAYLLQAQQEKAKQAYQAALDHPRLSGAQRQEVQLKLDDLGTRQGDVLVAMNDADKALFAAGPSTDDAAAAPAPLTMPDADAVATRTTPTFTP